MEVTKEQLEYWRHKEGKSNVEIAQITGKSIGSINTLFSRYKIKKREMGISKEKIEIIQKMSAAGSRGYQIAAELGISRAAVYKYMPNNKTDEEFALPPEMTFAEKKEPTIFEVVINGKHYIDVTDLWIPY